MATGLAGNVDHARTELGAVIRNAPELPGELSAAVARFSEGRSPYHVLVVAGCFALHAARRLARRAPGAAPARRVTARGSTRAPLSATGARHLVMRVVVDLLALVAVSSCTRSRTFLLLYQGHEASRELIVSALLAAIQARLVIAIARFLLAPHAPVAAAAAVRRRSGSHPLPRARQPRLACTPSSTWVCSSSGAGACRASHFLLVTILTRFCSA